MFVILLSCLCVYELLEMVKPSGGRTEGPQMLKKGPRYPFEVNVSAPHDLCQPTVECVMLMVQDLYG